MAQKFKSGDIVQLRSGGPEMTVKEYKSTTKPDLSRTISDTMVICEWFDGSDLKSAVFSQDSLDDNNGG